jgi:uncharacterized protein YjbI with pentapeptide repeats
MRGTLFIGSSLPGATFLDIKADQDLSFQRAELNNVEFSRADLRKVDFTGAQMESANFGVCYTEYFGNECRLTPSNRAYFQADLRGADFSGATWNLNCNCDLREAKFDNLVVSYGNWYDRDFTGASFKGSSLSSVSIRGSTFNNADFSGSTITGLTVSESAFRSANFSGSSISNFIALKPEWYSPGPGSDFSGANFSGSTINSGTFSQESNLDLTGAVLIDVWIDDIEVR